MDNACYYTFSTVCQTLAGAFGFLVAVVLYQLQTTVKGLEGRFDDVTGNWDFDDPGLMQKARRVGKWTMVSIHLVTAKLKSSFDNFPEGERYRVEQMKEYIDDVKQLEVVKDGLRNSLRATGITIAVTLFLLILTPIISLRWWIASPFLVADVAAACYCLWTYFPLVRKITE